MKELWGEQTKKSLKFFNIGEDLFADEFLNALLMLKKHLCLANAKYNLLSKEKTSRILSAIEDIQQQDLQSYFCVKVWQTGSGTQINMNVNEVIAHIANNYPGQMTELVHPNDDVNMSHSSNDIIPAATQLACLTHIQNTLVSEMENIIEELARLQLKFQSVTKIARTHLMDAVPMTLGQEFSAFRAGLEHHLEVLLRVKTYLAKLPLGGTAVGTGLNCPLEISQETVATLSREVLIDLDLMQNSFLGNSTNIAVLELSSFLRNISCFLMKLAGDIAWLASGPHAGLNEFKLPANEAGSSIMPGKVNPTQCEAMQMVCCEIIGKDHSNSLGEMNNRFQLSTYRPLIAKNSIESLKLLTDVLYSFRVNCLSEIEVNQEVLASYVDKNNMIITALNPIIGYKKGEDVIKQAYQENKTVRDKILELDLMQEEELDRVLKNLTSRPRISGAYQ